jgi:glycosyltransferase involved in cell wall biosynthesis
MRIACLAASEVPSRKANSIRVMKVCQAFRELGHEIKLWLPGDKPTISWAQLAEHYRLRETFEIRWLPTIGRLKRYDFGFQSVSKARAWGADLIYAWPLQAGCLASILGLPTVFEVHDQPRGIFGPLLFRLMLWGRGLKRILPISEALETWLQNEYGFLRFGVESVVIRSGVDPEGYEELPEPDVARRQLGIKDTFTVGYSGHLYPGRGIELLYQLAKRNPGMQFLWVGGEPEAVRSWKNRIDQEKIGNIVMTGFILQEDLPTYQAASDVLVMPYEQTIIVSSGANTEKFASPMKLFEYMAAGRAIISSNLPVLREVLNDELAVLAPPEDVEAWDRELKRLMDEPDRRSQMSRQARKEVRKYSWQERARKALSGLEIP